MSDRVSEITLAIKQICEEKKISYDSVITTIEAALAVAYRKDFGEKNQNIQVEFDADTGGARVFDEKTVVADELKEKWEQEKAEREAADALAEAPATGLGQTESGAATEMAGKDKNDQKEAVIPTPTLETTTGSSESPVEAEKQEAAHEEEERFDPKMMFTLAEAKEKKKDAAIGDAIRTELFPPSAYGRMAAQTAKQVIIQKLREAERENIFKEFKDKEGTIINAVIQRVEGRMVLIDLGQATALMPPGEQIPTEQYTPGQRIKVYVVSVAMTPKGPEIIVSRGHPQMVVKLFAMEVPEIAAGSVEIKMVAREPGSRTKVAVSSNQKNIDPVGSCVGQRGTRVQTVIGEIGGEKIDIIEYADDPIQLIANALSPAKVLTIKLNDVEKIATAEVKEDQLSLAIGKAGQNVRLAARLTGWKIDIVSEAEAAGATKKESEETAAPAAPSTEAKPAAADQSAVTPTDSGEGAAPPAEEKTDAAAVPTQSGQATEQPTSVASAEPPSEAKAVAEQPTTDNSS